MVSPSTLRKGSGTQIEPSVTRRTDSNQQGKRWSNEGYTAKKTSPKAGYTTKERKVAKRTNNFSESHLTDEFVTLRAPMGKILSLLTKPINVTKD